MMQIPMSHCWEQLLRISYRVTRGVVSDIHGAYEIKLPEGGVDLVFSYVGYEDVLMPIVIDRREVITKAST